MSATQQELSPLDQAREAKQNHAEAPAIIRETTRQFTYPSWPTSKPGPQITFPPAGQKSHPMRTDQMVYEETYDQVHGRPSVSSLPTSIIRENRTRIYVPERSMQEVTFENEAVERWLDDGGIEGRR